MAPRRSRRIYQTYQLYQLCRMYQLYQLYIANMSLICREYMSQVYITSIWRECVYVCVYVCICVRCVYVSVYVSDGQVTYMDAYVDQGRPVCCYGEPQGAARSAVRSHGGPRGVQCIHPSTSLISTNAIDAKI